MGRPRSQQEYTRYTVRVPSELYERLSAAAGEKSINAEIIERLDRSFMVDTERSFLERLASGGFVEPLPAGLAARIQSKAEEHKRTVAEEVIQALENAFPPPPPFSLDDFFDEWAYAIIEEKDLAKKAQLVEQANAILRENGDKYEVWLNNREGQPSFAFGSKGSREFEEEARKKREQWGKL